jgi:hypothetical protein
MMMIFFQFYRIFFGKDDLFFVFGNLFELFLVYRKFFIEASRCLELFFLSNARFLYLKID